MTACGSVLDYKLTPQWQFRKFKMEVFRVVKAEQSMIKGT